MCLIIILSLILALVYEIIDLLDVLKLRKEIIQPSDLNKEIKKMEEVNKHED